LVAVEREDQRSQLETLAVMSYEMVVSVLSGEAYAKGIDGELRAGICDDDLPDSGAARMPAADSLEP
jgi:hypothetical protein